MELSRTCFSVFNSINCFLAYPSLLIFLGTAIILTIKLRFLQARGFGKFIRLIVTGIDEKEKNTVKTISPFHALFSAMATTIGMGNIIGPSIAISLGGPGALFWLLVYIILGSATKFVEVTLSVYTRTVTAEGDIIGGPTQYLRLISHPLAAWYGLATMFLFTGWSGLQVNTLASIWAQEGIPHWVSGLVASSILLLVVLGGVRRIGFFASRIVPLKFIVYVTFALIILFKNPLAILAAIKLVGMSIFKPAAAVGGFMGATAFAVMREGIYKGIFITESGIGTSSISHALSDVKNPSDQGVLAMFSSIADLFLCSLSGLIALVTGVWSSGKLNNTLAYEAFKLHAPFGGNIVLAISILLFVITALIGNTYNGSQSFASFTKHKHITVYFIFAAVVAFLGALADVPLLWEIMDVLLALVAIPHLIALLIISFRYPKIFELKN